MICKKCGYEIEEGASFCTQCGTPAVDRQVQLSNEDSSQTKKEKIEKKQIFGWLIVLVGIAIVVCWSLAKSNNNSSDSSYDDLYTYQPRVQTSSPVIDLKISRIEVRHSRNYTYISGSITNESKTTKYRSVKVKAVCYGVGNKVIDTDWTYAVDSAWLEPGETKNFEMMVKDPNGNIKSAKVTIMDN